ncbi:hypothetical protein BH11ARM2_BH11ARM2_31100 [soil metagenome]
MSLAMLMFLPPMGPPDEALARYEKWQSTHPAYSLEGAVTMKDGKDKILFELRTRKPDSIWFRVRYADEDFRMSKTANALIETEAGDHVYDEGEGFPGMRISASDISLFQKTAYPAWLIAATGKQLFPGDATAEKSKMDGRELTLVHTLQKSPQGEYEAWGWFNPDGSPCRFRRRFVNSQESSDLTWTLSPIGSLKGTDPFALPIPNDYIPHRLPPGAAPYEMGTAIKLGTWKRGGRSIDLDKETSGTALLAVLTPGEAPSQRMEAALDDLEKGGLKVVRISDATNDPTMVYDPTGNLLKKLRLPATPYLMLIKDGKIAGLWLGAGENQKETVDDVRVATK